VKVYEVKDNDSQRIIEAEDFADAVKLFREWVQAENGEGYDDWQPTSLELISDEPVLRR